MAGTWARQNLSMVAAVHSIPHSTVIVEEVRFVVAGSFHFAHTNFEM